MAPTGGTLHSGEGRGLALSLLMVLVSCLLLAQGPKALAVVLLLIPLLLGLAGVVRYGRAIRERNLPRWPDDYQ